MLRLAFANARAHRSRLALTWLAIVLGVAFVTGSLVLTDTSDRLLDERFRTAAGGIDLVVRDTAAFDSGMGVEVERDPLPAGLPARIAAQPGVADVLPVASGQGLIRYAGKAIVPNGASLLASWAAPPFSAYELRAGRAPEAADEVVVDAATAAAHGIALGRTIDVASVRTATLRVVGIAGIGDDDGLPNTTVALVALPTAQRLLDLGDGLTEVDVVAGGDRPLTRLRAELAEALGAGLAVSSSQDAADASAAAAKESVAHLYVVLLALAGAGLVVGAFLITNTFSIVLTQRTRELALLRAAGATGRQVTASILAEALLVGLTGALAGTAAGVGAATAFRDAARGLGLALPDGALVVGGRTLVVGVALGTVVTLLAALGPARRAGRTAPVEAMRQSAGAERPAGRRRRVAGAVAAVLAAVQLGTAPLAGNPRGVGIGALLLVAALVLLGPVLAPPLTRLVGRPFARGVAGRLAQESAGRAPRRTAATATALALGLTLVTFVSVLASSVKATVGAAYAEVVTADLVVESARNEMLGGLSPEVARRVSALPEVATVSALRYGHWKDRGMVSALAAVDPATVADVARVRPVAGDLAGLDAGGVAIAEHVARSRGLAVGDRLPMTFSRTGDQQLRVAAVVKDRAARALGSDFLISLRTYAAQFSERADATVFVGVAGGVTAAAAQDAIETALAGYPTAEVRDQAAAVAGRAAALDQVLGLVMVLLLFAVLIALLGITNTLALSIVERTREIGLLRAVGMTRRQLGAAIRAEAAFVALLSVVAGVGAGAALAASMLGSMRATAPVEVVVPVGRLALVVAVATVAGLLAGLLPARRAARLDVLAAIAAP